MGRKRRIILKNAQYHTILRGNCQQTVFFDDVCRLTFYKILENATLNHQCKIHFFCLMTNHIHLFIETSVISISKIMQSIGGTYAKFINKRYGRVGHLFQGRFNSNVVQTDKYRLNLCYYIHSNPIAANMVSNLDSYRWSSHRCYSGNENISWLTTSYIDAIIKRQTSSGQKHSSYTEFMHLRDSQTPELGGIQLDDNGCLTILDEPNLPKNKSLDTEFWLLSIREIIMTVCECMDVDLEQLHSVSLKQEHVLARSLAAYYAHYFAGYPLKRIAPYFDMKSDSLGRALRKVIRSDNYHMVIEEIRYQLNIKLENKLYESDTARLDL